MIWEILQDKRVRYILAGLLVFIMLSAIINFLFSSDTLEVTRTNLQSIDESLEADSDTVRGFNGIHFYKIPTTSESAPEILGGGGKLPSITEAVWARDKGVLLTFDQSFIRTEVEKYARENNLDDEEYESATWYYDFTRNTLSYVSSESLLKNQGYYSSHDNGIYYLTSSQGGDIAGRLHFYNIATQKNTRIAVVDDLLTVDTMGSCKNTGICLTGRKPSDPATTQLLHVDKLGKKGVVQEVKGKIELIKESPWYIVLDDKDDPSAAVSGDMAAYTRFTLVNAVSKDIKKVERTMVPDGFMLLQYNDERFSIIGDDEGGQYSVIGNRISPTTITTSQLQLKDEGGFDDAIVINRQSTTKQLLFDSSDNQTYLYAQSGYIKNKFDIAGSKEALLNVKSCVRDGTNISYQEDSRLFTIRVIDNEAFPGNVKKISKCIGNNSSILLGYTFSFVSVDANNGRVTSY